MKTMRILVVAALMVVSTAAMALTFDSKGKLTWRFLVEPYSSSYDSSGIPKVINASLKKVPSNDFLTRLGGVLPERRDIRTNNPDLITDDFGANVHLKKAADVYVTFIHEGAAYKNSFGFFSFPDNQVPQTKNDVRETIVFPNASFNNDGGSSLGLRLGDTVKLGHFDVGQNIGFLVVANGFDSKSGVTTKPTGGPPGGGAVYYTLKHLNPESDSAMKAHTVLLNDVKSGMIVLGMEDLNRGDSGCDHDFNDTLYSVHSDPADAIDVSDIAPVPEVLDRDKDGVLDGNDDHPDDPARAFDIFTPSSAGFGTFVFEDSWPLHGDYDFNDMVVRYQFLRVENRDGKVLDLVATFKLAAWGSGNNNGFALHLPGVVASLVQTATLTLNGGTAQAIVPEAGQSSLVYQIFADQQAVAATSGATCTTFNTQTGCYAGEGPEFQLRVAFKTPQTVASLGAPPWDPFVFRTAQRGHEIHMVNHAPTALADMSLFGTGDDNSVVNQGIWYKSICNLPFALDIPEQWAWPVEGVEFSTAYPNFLTWVNASGASAKDWYKTDVVTDSLWSH